VRKATLAAVAARKDSLFHSIHKLTTGCAAPGDRGIFSGARVCGCLFGKLADACPGYQADV